MIAVVLTSVAVMAACGDSDDEQAVSVTTPEAEYLEKVDGYVGKIDGMVDGINQDLGRMWPTSGALIRVLEDADLSGTLETVAEDVGHLAPPGRFQVDHERYTAGLLQALDAARDHDRALDDNDLVSAFVARADVEVALELTYAELSPDLCSVVVASERAAELCAGDQSIPGGEYGTGVRSVIKRYAAKFAPLAASFPDAFTPEERYVALEALKPAIENVLQETLGSLRALEPPQDLRSDHDRVIQYVEETSEIFQAMARAVDAQDSTKTREEINRSATVFCDAREDLSPTAKAIVGFFFRDAPVIGFRFLNPPKACASSS